MKIIAALTEDRVIGKNNSIPWHIPEDFKHFKEETQNSTILMGRKTYESIGRPLPNRDNVVISRTLEDEKVYIARSLEEALAKAKEIGKDIYVIGGSKIYQEAMPIADELILSWIKKKYEGDTYFPRIQNEWKPYKEEDHDEFKVVRYKNNAKRKRF